VDATYQSDLRELNEINFTRFDAKLEQRFAVFETRIIRWMFTLWTGTMLAVVGLIFAVLRSK
jgi:hypothetical protein